MLNTATSYIFISQFPHKHCLEKTLRGSHGALNVKGPDVLPVLLQERHEEIDGQMDVLDELIFVHLDVTDGDVQAQHLKIKE